MDTADRIRGIEERLLRLDQEKKRLFAELTHLRRRDSKADLPLLGLPAGKTPPVTGTEKLNVFLSLFRCREDVYPRLWCSRSTRKQGYSPVCRNEWVDNLCNKPQVKCTECLHQDFAPLDAKAALNHLEGKITIGTYAIRGDDTCTFIAADFDKKSWVEDVLAYKHAAQTLGIGVAIERSRSGNGAHAWIFFSQPLPAGVARQLGTVIMARAASRQYTLGFDSYDRFFPNQDFIPKGGFGNLIALPLQRSVRRQGNAVFIDDEMTPYIDQWEFLAKQRRLTLSDVVTVLDKVMPKDDSPFFFPSRAPEVLVAEKAIDYVVNEVGPGFYPGRIHMELGGQLAINIDGLPSKLISAFKRMGTFANPRFFELQRLRFSTWKTPRYICCGELVENRLVLPRGTIKSCMELAKTAGAQVSLIDNRIERKKIQMRFRGKLSRDQHKAVIELLKHENGVLVAPPGIGKTVIACSVMGKRKARTLILVHRKQLLDQWKSKITQFLTIDPKKVGIWGANSRQITGFIDIAMLQTLSRMRDVQPLLSSYEQVIVDECHHIPAYSFESVLKQIPARHFLGLTATPFRKDGQQAIIYMQCGPIRHDMGSLSGPKLVKRVIVRETSFAMPPEAGPQPSIHAVWERLTSDSERLAQVARDVKEALQSGRFPLILSERKKHLQLLSEAISRETTGLPIGEFLFVGEMGKRARKKALEEIRESLKRGDMLYILSTGSLMGEGFDLPELDTLFLAMPISFKGRIIQYAGRLHRMSPGKNEVLIYDYLDNSSGLTVSMFKKRIAVYKKMGYRIESASKAGAERKSDQGKLFGDD